MLFPQNSNDAVESETELASEELDRASLPSVDLEQQSVRSDTTNDTNVSAICLARSASWT